MTDADKDGVYEVTVPTDKKYPNVIFCRMNPSASANNWNNKWNQTSDLTIPTNGTNHYTVKAGTWDKGGGTWSTFGSTCAHTNLGPAATCTTPQVCQDCKDPVVAALGHNYNTTHLCTRCNTQAPFTVAGSAALCGSDWSTTDTKNDMTFADGVYTKVYENVAAGTYKFKVARDHDWGTAYPSQDKSFKVDVAGSTVTITLKGTTVDVKVELPVTECPHENRGPAATCTENQVCLDCEEVVVVATGHPGFDASHMCTACGGPAPFTIAGSEALCGSNWSPADTNNDMIYENGLWTKVYEDVKKGTYEFKVVRDHDLDWAVAYPGQNKSFTVTTDGSIVVITFNGSAVDVTVSAPHVCEYTEPATCLKGQHCKCGLVDPENTELGDHVYANGICSVCGQLNLEDTVVIYFENNWAWPTVHFFYWYGENGNNAAWPGVDLKDPVAKTVEGHDVYMIEVPVGVSGLIFSGDGQYGAEQCKDITKFESCDCFYMTWDEATQSKPAAVKEYHAWTGATCETPAVCSVCQAEGEALGHDMIVDKAVAPTCEDKGLTEGSHCSRCDHKVAQEEVDALGHDMVVDKAVDPTCTATGLTEGSHCTRCDHVVAQEEVDALGHDMIVDKAVAPTCEDKGLTEGSHCSRCDHKVAQEEVDTLGHDMVVDKAVAPTCEDKGLTEGSHCSRCDHKVAQEEVDALGHVWGGWIVDKEATEEEDGEQHRVCDTCGDVETGIIPSIAHTHNYTPAVTTEPTCEADGVKTFSCGCGDAYTEAIPALGHDMVTDTAVAPTCTATGLTEGSHCTRCDHKVAQEEVPALGHDMVVDKAVAPTCTATGLTEGSHCSRCDHKVAQEEVSALGHEFDTYKSICSVCYAPNPDFIVNTIDVTKENKLLCNKYHLVGDLGPYEFITFKIENAGHYKFVGTGLAFTIYTISTEAPGADFTAGTGASWAQYVFTEADLEPGTYWVGIVFFLGEGEYTVTVEYTAPHSHSFVDGKCECGEEDPNYVPPHEHDFVDGKCECGEEDPNYIPPHEHNFVNGECECGEKDPNYVAPDEDKPSDNVPELTLIQKILKAITDFFKNIKDFFVGLFKK